MKKLLLLPVILFSALPVSSQEVYPINVNRVCAAIVQIPYASDNFTDEEWKQFETCYRFMKQFEEQ
jgi:hypothetical protein